MTTPKMGIERVAILGANSLLAHHLFMTSLPDCHKESPLKAISLWNFDDEFTFSQASDISELFDGVDLKLFSGMLSLRNAIDGCDTIFNLHEVHDFSVVPNKRALKTHNVGVVQILLKMCEFVHAPVRIVHLSSVYLQVSSRWPNVYGREAADYFQKFRTENPFPAYCSSKHEAEQLFASASSENLQSVCARVGPLYGEGDRCSLICDSILLSKHHPQIPLVGDQSGVLQLTYAGNAADALMKCAKKLADDSSVRNELVLIGDATPIRNFYDLAIKPLYEEDKEDKGESAFQPKISRRRISFYLFYPIYTVLAFIAYLVSTMFNVKAGLSKIPSPSYLYLVFHHWTFFNDFKLRTFFDYVPRFDYSTSLKRSLGYYRKLTPDKIAKYSWMP